VTAAPRLQKVIERPNTVLYITAANPGGVPIAVKRFINPRLPLDYKLGPEDVVFPGEAWEGTLTVKVDANRHGEVGVTKPGDLRGFHKGQVRSGSRDVDIVIEEEL